MFPSLSEKEVTVLRYSETVTQMGCEFHFQIRLPLPKMEESNSIPNHITGYIRECLVTHLWKPAGLCQMKQFGYRIFKIYRRNSVFGRCFPLRLSKVLGKKEI